MSEHTDETAQPSASLANVALSVWSNTCNAHCSEGERVHEPECLLAAGLHRDLAHLVTPPGAPS